MGNYHNGLLMIITTYLNNNGKKNPTPYISFSTLFWIFGKGEQGDGRWRQWEAPETRGVAILWFEGVAARCGIEMNQRQPWNVSFDWVCDNKLYAIVLFCCIENWNVSLAYSFNQAKIGIRSTCQSAPFFEWMKPSKSCDLILIRFIWLLYKSLSKKDYWCSLSQWTDKYKKWTIPIVMVAITCLVRFYYSFLKINNILAFLGWFIDKQVHFDTNQ